MAVAEAPTSYKDPYWSDLASSVEQKLELPKGLLVAVLTRGERSNADQVSEAGAKTPFQIIPSTRKAALDKFGVDAYLSPANAAEVAGRLLKDSLDRNQGDASLAVAEYHGGTDRANWGPRTRSYVQRVVGAQPQAVREAAPAAAVDLPASPTGSTFDRVLAEQKAKTPATQQISAIYDAYQAGQMTPEEEQQFEADVRDGRMMLPRGAKLAIDGKPVANTAPPGGALVLPDPVARAYADGRMSTEERIQLENDVRAGLVRMPQGAQIGKTERPGIAARMAEAVTGRERATEQTQTLPDWASMPELNSFSLASAKTGLGTLLSNPAETVQIIKANFPGVQVTQDEKGNYLLTSSIDGQQYAIKPGFAVSDVPRAAGAVAAFTPAGRATSVFGAGAANAATQAAIEASQAATGGEFNGKDVAVAGALGAAVPAVVNTVRAVVDPAAAALTRMRGTPSPAADTRAAAEALPTSAPAPAVPAAAAPAAPAAAAPAAQLTTDELGQQMRTAALGGLGSKQAKQVLAQSAAPDAETVAAARRLGIEQHLQPDHVTTNQAFRQLSQLVKSQTGSQAAVAQREGLEKVAQRANDLIDTVGGSSDLSKVSADVRAGLEATRSKMEGQAEALYAQVEKAIPKTLRVEAPDTLGFLEAQARDLGGAERLLPVERKLLKTLSAMEDGSSPVTYAFLDRTRKEIGQALQKASGPFKDSETGLLKKLYGTLSNDQERVAQAQGAYYRFQAAKYATTLQKGVEDDLKALFGREVDKSMTPLLTGAVKRLAQGDESAFVGMISTVPKDLRQQVTASGLASFFQRTTRGGEMDFAGYARWYEGLQRNHKAYSALMGNLPKQTAQQLADLARVSRGVAMAKGEFISTGKAINPRVLEAADTLMGRIYDEVKRRGVSGLAAEAIGTSAGAPGLASALASATMSSKPSIVQAADRLIASPEFIAAARSAGTPQQAAAARALAFSKPFTRFVRAIGQPRELSNRERWILQAMQAQQNLSPERK